MKKWLKIILWIIGIIILLIVVDLIFIFTINRPLFAVQVRQPYTYHGIFYDVYNCPEYSMPQIKSKGSKFYCAVESIDEVIVPTTIENVSIDIFDISLTGATVIITDTNQETYVYSEWYRIEQSIDGKWQEVKTVTNNYGFNEMGYLPDKNNEVKFIINWEHLYGELSLGSYRILKQVNNQYISVEFSIAETS